MRRTVVTRLGFLAVVPLVLAGFLSACSSSTTTSTGCTGTKAKVYMVGSTTNSTFWQAIQSGFLQGAAAFCLDGIYSAPLLHTDTTSIALLQAAIAAKPAGIAINYTDHTIQQSTLDALNAGIKVVLFNNQGFDPTAGDPTTATTDPKILSLAYVGQDEHTSGITLATQAVNSGSLSGVKNVLWYPVVPEVEVIALRNAGLEKVLQPLGIKEEFLQSPGAPGAEGLDETQDEATVCPYIQAHPEIGAIFGTSITSTGAAKCLIQLNKHIPIFEFDCDLESAQDIQNGWITACVDQQPFWQGFMAAENLAEAIHYKLAPVNVNTGTLVVTKANVSDLMFQIQNHKG